MQDTNHPRPGMALIEPRFPFGADFQDILSLIGDAVVITDANGKIILFNRAAVVFAMLILEAHWNEDIDQMSKHFRR